MVTQEVATQLQNAAWLLKTGDRVEAYRILKALVRQDPVDWRAWWGLVHAAPNPEERLVALRKTVQFNPQHTKAVELLRKAEALQARPTAAKHGTLHQTRSQPPAVKEKSASPFMDAAPAVPAVFTEPEVEDDESHNPFGAYEIVESKSHDAWGNEATRAAPTPRRQPVQVVEPRSAGDRVMNIAIAVLGILVVVGLLALVITRIDLSGLTASAAGSPQPTSYTGGDPFRTTGGGILTIGEAGAQDSVYNLDEAHNWSFEAEAGQQVTIIAEAIGETDPRIRLIDPDGKVIAEDDDGGWDRGLGYWDSYMVYTLPSSGLYTIRIDVFIGGQFTLSVN